MGTGTSIHRRELEPVHTDHLNKLTAVS
jgi:hypothetical protein